MEAFTGSIDSSILKTRSLGVDGATLRNHNLTGMKIKENFKNSLREMYIKNINTSTQEI